MNNYTTKTASLLATIGDIRKLNSRVIDSKEIKLDGTNIKDLWGFQDPEDFKKLVKRCELPEGSNYILWTDTGQIAYMSFADRLINGNSMFQYTPLKSFNGDLSSLTNGERMFCNTALKSFSGDLSSLTNGNTMFSDTALESFSGDLPSLTDGYRMFSYCSALQSFSGDMSSLTNGERMFSESALESFNGDLSSLINGKYMFYNTALTSFNGDLSSLEDGSYMFFGTPLKSFNGDLSSLINGGFMFFGCKLNLESVQNIASTIKTVSSGSITIGIQSSLQGNADLTTALTTIGDKGWTVTAQYNA